MNRVHIEIQYAPRSIFLPYHNRTQRFTKITAHRRAGKTVACLNEKIKAALCNTRSYPPPHYSYIAPTFTQAKDIAWEYLKYYSSSIPGRRLNESELWVELPNNARIRLYGAENYDRMRGTYNDGVTVDEPGHMDPRAYPSVIRPTLSDYKGWATFIGTPNGRNWFYSIDRDSNGFEIEGWFRLVLKASETNILDEAELADARQTLTPEQYQQEYECSFDAAILGAYYGQEIAQAEREGRITSVPYDKNVPVYAAWDLGKGANMAVWLWQMVGREIHIIDYHEGSHSDGIPQTVIKLDAKPFRIENDWVPHDAKATEIGTGRTRIEQLLTLNRKPKLVRDHKEDDGIAAARLSLPNCYFDRIKCADGIEALRQFRADFDEKTKAFKDHPKADWTNHAADAFRYLAMAWKEMVPDPVKPKSRILSVGALNTATLDDMFEANEARRPRREGRI